MRVKRVTMLADDHAVVHLSPSWLARLFGAKDVVAELQRSKAIGTNKHYWWCKRTAVMVDFMAHGSLLTYALQFQPLETKELGAGDPPTDEAGVVSLPNARWLKKP